MGNTRTKKSNPKSSCSGACAQNNTGEAGCNRLSRGRSCHSGKEHSTRIFFGRGISKRAFFPPSTTTSIDHKLQAALSNTVSHERREGSATATRGCASLLLLLCVSAPINHGIFSPLGIQQSEELGRSIFFLIEA